MSATREELARLLAMHRAAAGALERELKHQARNETEQGNGAPTWRLAAARVSGRVSHAQAVVTDEQAFLKYVEAQHPGSTREVREPVNARFVSQVREYLADTPERNQEGRTTGRVLDGEGTVVPGLAYERGGQTLDASITLTAGHTPALVGAAMAGIQTGDWSALYAYAEDGDVGRVLALLESVLTAPEETSPETPAAG